jgi:hypothetical protein
VVTNLKDEQARREAVAAVPVYEHQAEAAQRALDGVDVGVAKFRKLVEHAEAQRKPAQQALAAAQAELEEARKLAGEVLAAGPVSMPSGEVVYALAGVASAKGGTN